MITVNVRNWIRLRSGKSIGSARAAASETTPRMPAHATTVTFRQPGFGSRSRIPADSARGM